MSFLRKLSRVVSAMAAVFALAAISASAPPRAAAQNAPAAPRAEAPAAAIATASVRNARIVSQAGNLLTLAFDIANKQGAQGGIRYGVRLMRSSGGEAAVYDERAYDEEVSVSENAILHKEVVYLAPPGLFGSFDVYVFAGTADGLTLGIGRAGIVQLSGGGGITIFPETCFLQVENEKGSPRYTPTQGVDIDFGENLVAICAVSNGGAAAAAAAPVFKTRSRTMFGEKAEHAGGSAAKVTLAPGANAISLVVPKAAKPQAYDVTLRLAAAGGPLSVSSLSNSVVFHYVLRGPSATIQNIVLNKDSYRKGDTARVSFSWLASADSFLNSRAGRGTALSGAALTLALRGKDGAACAEEAREALNEEGGRAMEVNLPVTEDCVDPVISAVIKDGAGAALASREFAVTSIRKPAPSPLSGGLAAGILAALLAVAIAAIYLHRARNSGAKNGAGFSPDNAK